MIFASSGPQGAPGHATFGVSGTSEGRLGATGRVEVLWGPGATVEHKIEILDQRTRALFKEVGELQRSREEAERQLRQDLSKAKDELRGEDEQIRQAARRARDRTMRSDASALPIIVVGVALGGLAPDAAHWPKWISLAVLLLGLMIATWFGYKVVRSAVRSTGPDDLT